MILHFETDTGKYLSINTSPEAYNFRINNQEQIKITEAGYNKLLRILDFNAVSYADDIYNPQEGGEPWH